jgi:hypothetical protein
MKKWTLIHTVGTYHNTKVRGRVCKIVSMRIRHAYIVVHVYGVINQYVDTYIYYVMVHCTRIYS